MRQKSLSAGKVRRYSNNDKLGFDASPLIPLLPDNFFSELEKIESFYDAHLADLFPNIFAENGTIGQSAHTTDKEGTQANSLQTVRKILPSFLSFLLRLLPQCLYPALDGFQGSFLEVFGKFLIA